jgi:UDP-glucose 4-epimerase
VISTVEEITGLPVPRRLGPRRAGDPPALVADPRRAESLLRWKAKRTLRETISTAWKWMERRRQQTAGVL